MSKGSPRTNEQVRYSCDHVPFQSCHDPARYKLASKLGFGGTGKLLGRYLMHLRGAYALCTLTNATVSSRALQPIALYAGSTKPLLSALQLKEDVNDNAKGVIHRWVSRCSTQSAARGTSRPDGLVLPTCRPRSEATLSETTSDCAEPAVYNATPPISVHDCPTAIRST
jgi:hypothetical protein